MELVTPNVLPLALAAGWAPERSIAFPRELPLGHPASLVLEQFSGLVIRPRTVAGIECATTSLSFCYAPNGKDISEWEEALDCKLVHIAETDGGSSFLFMGSCGRCFGSSGIHFAFYLVGESFPEALENLLVGKRARPILAPTQTFVMLYGEHFDRGNPALWEHRHEA